jgi:hypothetical protein
VAIGPPSASSNLKLTASHQYLSGTSVIQARAEASLEVRQITSEISVQGPDVAQVETLRDEVIDSGPSFP